MTKLQYQITTFSRTTGQVVSRGLWLETREKLLPHLKQVLKDNDERWTIFYHEAQICHMNGNHVKKITSGYLAEFQDGKIVLKGIEK